MTTSDILLVLSFSALGLLLVCLAYRLGFLVGFSKGRSVEP